MYNMNMIKVNNYIFLAESNEKECGFMKKRWKRIVSSVCAIMLVSGTFLGHVSPIVQANSSAPLKNADEYLAFGADDTHLQLSKPLSDAPNVIEASVKMDEAKDGEWILRSGHTKKWDSWANLTANTKNYYIASQDDADTSDDGMDEGTKYVKIDLRNGQTFDLADFSASASIPSNLYTKDDLALTFWYYTSTGELPGGSILVSSNGGTTYFISWDVNHFMTDLKVGWNKITLPFKDRTAFSDYPGGDSGLDITGINFMRWVYQTAASQDVQIGLSDFKIVDLNQIPDEPQRWTLMQADGTLKEGANRAVTHTDFHYNQKVADHADTVKAADNAPAELAVGTPYISVQSYKDAKSEGGVDYKKGCIGFMTKYEGLSSVMPNLPAECAIEDLKLDFWLYSSTGQFPDGGFRLTTSGWANHPKLEWWKGTHIQIQPGWNHMELSLADAAKEPITEDFDYRNSNFFQMYTETKKTVLSEDTEFRFTDIQLVYTPKPPVKAVTVNTKEDVDATTIAGSNMIFSNTNVANETPYALYINSQGYPTLLWGSTQYTLTQNVRTGKFVTIKVVKNTAGNIEFYIDGTLKGTSSSTETDALGSFTTAHRIGADGQGAQLFKGVLANLSVYSDSAAAACIGAWTLEGEIQHVLETMQDTSSKDNDAVFRGTRAADWISYEEVKDKAKEYVGDDYWSMVFIPDIQKITKYDDSYNEAWMNVSKWIGDNVESENIKHVIAAGDSTDDNTEEQWNRTEAGFAQFWNKVSWSNMPGNHDYVRGAGARDSSKYQTHFGESAINSTAAKQTYSGSYVDSKGLSTTENSFFRFEVNGVDWMVLQLEYFPRTEVLNWADDILKTYSGDNVILTTHAYLNYMGNGYLGEDETYIHDGDGNANIDSTEEIWNQLKDNANIKMILCGHQICDNGEITQKNEVNDAGDIVPALMINAQTEDRGSDNDPTLAYFSDQPLGMLGIFRFSKDGSKVTLQYYSPEHDKTFNPKDKDGNRTSNDIKATFRLEEPAVQYPIYSSESGKNIVKDGGEIFYLIDDAGVQIPATGTIDNLVLSIKLSLADADAVAAAKNCWVELTNEIPDAKELCWSLADQNLVVGNNVVRLKLKDATPYWGNKNWAEYGAFTLDETVNCFRFYGSGNVSENDIKLHEVKLVETKVATPSVSTENKVPRIFSNGMLFQQNKPMNLWGYGTPGQTVEIFLYKGSEQVDKKKGTIGEDGRWDLAFDARQGSYDVYSIDIWIGAWNYAFGNVLVGELWVAGGQSNMELTVTTDMNSDEILANANDSFMRMFLYPNASIMRPIEEQKDIQYAWWGYGNNGTDVATTSSVAYHFAQNLRAELNVPVGIINTPKGGTVIESWLGLDAVEDDNAVETLLKQYDLFYGEDDWARKAGLMSTLYNQRIAPLKGMNVAGTIWYQGESNSDRSEIYDVELKLLKESWGKVFGYENGSMPFIFTQVAPYSYDNGLSNQQHLGYLAMYMERAFKLCDPDTTAMLTVYDQPLEHMKGGVSSDPIHPRNKAEVGKRFAESAMNMVYGGTEEYTAPMYKSMTLKDNAIYIRFDRVGNGLKTTDGTDDIHGFTIAGTDGVYVNAKAEFVNKNTVRVWNEHVSNPQDVMYAFDNYNQGANLCNSSMIPASPFRTVQISDTTLKPDASIQYFTAQDWTYADKDVWVYDSTNTENMRTGYRPSFKVDGGTYTYDSDILAEGSGSLKVSFSGDFSLSPILSYESIKQDWGKFKTLSVSMLNPSSKDVTVSMKITSGGITYLVPTIDGKDEVTLSGNGEEFKVVTFDLTALKAKTKAALSAAEILAALTDVTFDVTASEAGDMYFDVFSFGTTVKLASEEDDAQQKPGTPSDKADGNGGIGSGTKTGDTTNVMWYLILAIVAGFSAVVIYKKRKDGLV